MAQEILRVTQKLDIIEEDPETLKKDIFFSRVEDVGAESVLITTPFRRGFYLPPRIGRLIAVRVVADKIPYMFKANLLHYRAEQIPLWEISKPVSFYKIQLREKCPTGYQFRRFPGSVDRRRGEESDPYSDPGYQRRWNSGGFGQSVANRHGRENYGDARYRFYAGDAGDNPPPDAADAAVGQIFRRYPIRRVGPGHKTKNYPVYFRQASGTADEGKRMVLLNTHVSRTKVLVK